GIAVVHEDQLPARQPPPLVIIDRLIVDGHIVGGYGMNVAFGGAVRLSAAPQQLRVDYNSPSFTEPQNIRFKYQLLDLDKDWVDAGYRLSAYYPNLPPGNHVFEVIARNADGIWSAPDTAMTIAVPRAFRQTWWFRVPVLLAVLAAVAQAA